MNSQFEVKNGIKVVKDLLYKIKIDNTYKPFVLGKDVSPYKLQNRNFYVHYIKSNESLYTNQRFRTPETFEQPKVIVRQIPADRIYATFDNNNFYSDQTTYLIIHGSKDEDYLKALLAIMSSKLLFFYFDKTLSDNKEVFPKIKASHINSLPIPEVTPILQTDMIYLVNQTLAAKITDPTADTSALEAEIDRLVYGLYGLTEAEIALVEGRA